MLLHVHCTHVHVCCVAYLTTAVHLIPWLIKINTEDIPFPADRLPANTSNFIISTLDNFTCTTGGIELHVHVADRGPFHGDDNTEAEFTCTDVCIHFSCAELKFLQSQFFVNWLLLAKIIKICLEKIFSYTVMKRVHSSTGI